jgi:phosphotransferase system enzyme I (PtsI)
VHRLTGVGVSPGLVVGRAVLLRQNPLVVRFPIPDARVAEEVARLEAARDRSRRQLHAIKARIERSRAADLRYLFDAQLLMLDDRMVVARAADLIRAERVNAEWAVQRALEDLSGIFDGMEDAYLRERKGDVADVVGRLRMNLRRGNGGGPGLFRDVEAGSVLIADELTASMAAQVDWQKVRGFASDTGSGTHHTAILARSLHVPAVVGLGHGSVRVPPGALVVLDGSTGEVLVDPPDEVVEAARRRDQSSAGLRGRTPRAPEPTVTADGTPVRLQANIELPEDVQVATGYGADGIGLYRSEFLAALSPAFVTQEEAQYEAYRSLVAGMAPEVVTIRTFDMDERQLDGWRHSTASACPDDEAGASGSLGLRAIRLSLARQEMFRTQIRALLRASAHGRLRIIFPFVSGVEELREARQVVRDCVEELSALGQAVTAPPIGVMIEVPSAALTADLLAREADFFSIGTNDLIQYLLAVDRTDARVARLYEPLHPAVLRILRGVVRAATAQGIPVSLCGEMASDPAALPLLVGLGLREFSMRPAALPIARGVIRQLHCDTAARLTRLALRQSTAAEVTQVLSRAQARAGEGASPRPGEGGPSGHE